MMDLDRREGSLEGACSSLLNVDSWRGELITFFKGSLIRFTHTKLLGSVCKDLVTWWAISHICYYVINCSFWYNQLDLNWNLHLCHFHWYNSGFCTKYFPCKHCVQMSLRKSWRVKGHEGSVRSPICLRINSQVRRKSVGGKVVVNEDNLLIQDPVQNLGKVICQRTSGVARYDSCYHL